MNGQSVVELILRVVKSDNLNFYKKFKNNYSIIYNCISEIITYLETLYDSHIKKLII